MTNKSIMNDELTHIHSHSIESRLLPKKEISELSSIGVTTNLLSMEKVEKEMKESKVVYTLWLR